MAEYAFPHPSVSVDVVALTLIGDRLSALVIRRPQGPFRGWRALPGGFVRIDEPLDAAAVRVLRDKGKFDDLYHEQLYTFGAPMRDPRERVISVSYLAIVPEADVQAADALWIDTATVPRLAFDHGDILAMAVRRLRAKLDYSSISCRFLPETFTLTDLQRVFEIVLDTEVDKRNFRKQVLNRELVVPTGAMTRGSAHRPAKLYARNPSADDIG